MTNILVFLKQIEEFKKNNMTVIVILAIIIMLFFLNSFFVSKITPTEPVVNPARDNEIASIKQALETERQERIQHIKDLQDKITEIEKKKSEELVVLNKNKTAQVKTITTEFESDPSIAAETIAKLTGLRVLKVNNAN